jgi:hypothetical protein
MPKLTKHQLQKDQLRQRAIDLHNQDIPQPRIMQELQISKSTLRRWLRELGIPPKESRYHTNTKLGEPKVDPVEEVLATNLTGVLSDSIRLEKTNERQAEDLAILEHAAAQTSPAEKYQSYIAAGAVKLMRDSLKLVKPAKNIRELDQLDQIIRRSFGLDARSGGGRGKISIDVSILTNSKAALNGGAVGTGVVPTHTIDVKALRQNKGKVIDVDAEGDEVDDEVEVEDDDIEVEDEG